MEGLLVAHPTNAIQHCRIDDSNRRGHNLVTSVNFWGPVDSSTAINPSSPLNSRALEQRTSGTEQCCVA